MEKALSLQVLLFTILTNVPVHHQANAQVFCRSQFNLANEACSLKLYNGVRPTPLQQRNEAETGGYELQAGQGEGNRRQSHSHSHSHHHHHVEGGDPYDTACCRRLMGIDNSCICQAIARLPAFMTTVRHVIRLTPIPGCDVAFECAGSY